RIHMHGPAQEVVEAYVESVKETNPPEEAAEADGEGEDEPPARAGYAGPTHCPACGHKIADDPPAEGQEPAAQEAAPAEEGAPRPRGPPAAAEGPPPAQVA